jgi:hypothetical protein
MERLKRLASRLDRHPGTGTLAALVAVGFVAGLSGGSIQRGAIGAALMLLVFAPVVLATLPD